MINDFWRLLDWDYVCDQSPGIRIKHERASRNSEYGVNFYEFIETTEGLDTDVRLWWNSLTNQKQKELIVEKLNNIEDLRNSLKNAVEYLDSVE